MSRDPVSIAARPWKFGKKPSYPLFYFLSAAVMAGIVGVAAFVLQVSEVRQPSGRANIVGMFLLFQAYALVGMLIVVVPTGLIAWPVWRLVSVKLITAGRTGRQAAALAALPVGWVGIHLSMAALSIMNGKFWSGLFGLNYPVELWLLGIGSIVGPIVAWVIYRDE